MSFDLTNKNISDTYQNLLQKTGSNNQLFDLLGNPVTDLTIQGALIAESYIVSQSTLVFSSGSTAFGNSSDDTHNFIGSMNTTGAITASGNISGSNIVVENIFTGNGAQGGIQLNSSDTVFSQAVRPSVNNSYTLGTPSFKWSELNVNHITASGNISASGTGSFANLNIVGSSRTFKTLGSNVYIQRSDGTADWSHEYGFLTNNGTDDGGFGAFGSNTATNRFYIGTNYASNYLVVGARGDSNVGNVGIGTNSPPNDKLTVAGNISASGDMFAHSGSFNYITASVLDLDGQTLRIGGESFTRENIQTLKLGRSLKPLRAGKSRPDFEAEDGRFDGDITASGDILNTQTIQMTNSSSVINTFNTGSHKTCKYVLQVTSGSHIQSSEMLVMVSASSAVNTEYAQINSGLNLLDFSSKVNGSNVELIGSSSFISCSVKLNRKLI